MKRSEQVTSHPYGYLVIDLKSDTPEKDRLYTEIYDTTKTIDEIMVVDEGSVDTIENEEEEIGGDLRRKIEEEEEAVEVTSVMRSDLPPGRRECQKVKEHTICLAKRTNRNDCFLRQPIVDRLNRWIIPRQKRMLMSLIPAWTTRKK